MRRPRGMGRWARRPGAWLGLGDLTWPMIRGRGPLGGTGRPTGGFGLCHGFLSIGERDARQSNGQAAIRPEGEIVRERTLASRSVGSTDGSNAKGKVKNATGK